MTRTARDYIALALKPEKLRALKLQGSHPCQEPRCPKLVAEGRVHCTHHWKELRYRSKPIHTPQEQQA